MEPYATRSTFTNLLIDLGGFGATVNGAINRSTDLKTLAVTIGADAGFRGDILHPVAVRGNYVVDSFTTTLTPTGSVPTNTITFAFVVTDSARKVSSATSGGGLGTVGGNTVALTANNSPSKVRVTPQTVAGVSAALVELDSEPNGSYESSSSISGSFYVLP